MANFTGTAGNDDISGAAAGDEIDLTQGGVDKAAGKGGADDFFLGATLTTADRLNGGAGDDQLWLDGDYSAGLVFAAGTAVGFETINFLAGHSYRITLNDAANALASGYFNIEAPAMGAGDTLILDASSETVSGFHVRAGAGSDQITTGAGVDSIELTTGGDDTASAGAGGDFFVFNGGFTAADRLDGGDGVDELHLSGDFSAGVSLTPTTMVNVELVTFGAGHSYGLTFHDATVAAGRSMTVDGLGLGASDRLTISGAAETDGAYDLRGGEGADRLTGGRGADTLTGRGGDDRLTGGTGADHLRGGAGSDTFTGNAGADVFAFDWGDSPDARPDQITDLANIDSIDLSGIDADPVTGGRQSLVLVAAFTHHAGEMRLSFDASANLTSLLMDRTGDAVADMTILMKGDHTGFTNFVV